MSHFDTSGFKKIMGFTFWNPVVLKDIMGFRTY